MKQTNIPVIRITATEISIPTALINMKGVTVVNIVKEDEDMTTSPAPESVRTTPEPTTHEPTTLPPTTEEPTTYPPTTEEPTTSTLEAAVDEYLR